MHQFDAQAQKAFLTRISRGRSPAIAAEECGFALSTVKAKRKSDREFDNAFNDALALVNGAVEEVLLEKALDGDFQSIREWLHNRAGERWREEKTLNQQISGPGGSPIQIAQSSVLTLRQVLADPDTRANALDMVRDMPALGDGAIDTTGE